MELILLEKIRKLGNLGDKVSVRPGYGRNFLIPQGKAVRVTEKNLAEFEARRASLEEKAAEMLNAARERAEALAKLPINIPALVGEEGKLFGSVGTREIAMAIAAAGIEVEKSDIRLPKGALRYIGEYDIDVQLHSDVTQIIKINIVPAQ
jgi:large subunit ribosomal protein L9